MCSRINHNGFSQSNTVEDLIEEFRTEGVLTVNVSSETGLLVLPTDTLYATHYGETDTSVPCDAFEVTYYKDEINEEELSIELSMMLNTGSTKKTAVSGDKDLDKEIIETDISDDMPILADSEIYTEPTWKQHEFTIAERIMFVINKANTTFFLNKKMHEAEQLANVPALTPIEKTYEEDGRIVRCVPEYTVNDRISAAELDEIRTLYKTRMNEIIRENGAVRRYEYQIRKGYTQSYLLKVAETIKSDTFITETAKKWLRKVFNVQDYQICQKFYCDHGRGLKMIKNKKKMVVVK